MMTPKEREFLRQAILLCHTAAVPVGLAPETLAHALRQHSLNPDLRTITQELDYLVDKGWLKIQPSALAHGVKRSHITAPGREYLEGEGFLNV